MFVTGRTPDWQALTDSDGKHSLSFAHIAFRMEVEAALLWLTGLAAGGTGPGFPASVPQAAARSRAAAATAVPSREFRSWDSHFCFFISILVSRSFIGPSRPRLSG